MMLLMMTVSKPLKFRMSCIKIQKGARAQRARNMRERSERNFSSIYIYVYPKKGPLKKGKVSKEKNTDFHICAYCSPLKKP